MIVECASGFFFREFLARRAGKRDFHKGKLPRREFHFNEGRDGQSGWQLNLGLPQPPISWTLSEMEHE